jgi:hypothetical protein
MYIRINRPLPTAQPFQHGDIFQVVRSETFVENGLTHTRYIINVDGVETPVSAYESRILRNFSRMDNDRVQTFDDPHIRNFKRIYWDQPDRLLRHPLHRRPPKAFREDFTPILTEVGGTKI